MQSAGPRRPVRGPGGPDCTRLRPEGGQLSQTPTQPSLRFALATRKGGTENYRFELEADFVGVFFAGAFFAGVFFAVVVFFDVVVVVFFVVALLFTVLTDGLGITVPRDSGSLGFSSPPPYKRR